MTLGNCCRDAQSKLETHYPPGEAREMVRIIMAHLKGYTPVDLIIKADDEVSDFISGKVDAIVKRLLNDEPIQYIFGDTQFYGLTLKVNSHTLIPRPETEELVDFIVKYYSGRSDLNVLDIATGSGCIAIALARNLPFASVCATDISADALEVARANATSLKTDVKFKLCDIMSMPASDDADLYDIVVSNPPYIATSEKAAMAPNVLEYEPHGALFVPDSDPLKFYHAISNYALKALRNAGKIYFEINPLYADALKRDMNSAGWGDVTLLRDISGKYRFLTAIKQPY